MVVVRADSLARGVTTACELNPAKADRMRQSLYLRSPVMCLCYWICRTNSCAHLKRTRVYTAPYASHCLPLDAPGYERRVCHVLPLVERNLERTLEKGIHRRHIFISPLQSRRSKVRTYRLDSQRHMADTIEAVFV